MVEIREESGVQNDNQSQSSASGDNTSTTFTDYLSTRFTDVILFFIRLVTIFCTVYYILPIGNRTASYSAYSKAFIAAAATNALRVHQRVGGFRFNREFLSTVLLEDSCHYLIYSVIFITTAPVTMALIPIFIYALLHSADFAAKFCLALGKGVTATQTISRFMKEQTQSLFAVVACAEIFMMPMLIAMIFAGRASLFLPFIYYRFIVLRYMSRRNPYSRMVFYQLRVFLEQAVSSQRVPQVIRGAVYSMISLVSRLCPATTV